MAMQKSDILSDLLVQNTAGAFRETILEKYKGNEYGPSAESLEARLDKDNPLIDILAETDSLEPVIAAVLIAEQYAGYTDINDVLPKLDKEVGAALKLLQSEEVMSGPQALISSGNPVALKFAVGMIASLTSGEEFEEMKAEASPAELGMMMGQITGPVTDLAEHLSEGDNWKALPPKLLERYIETVETLAALSTSKTQKRVMTSIVDELKASIAKANTIELIETTAPKIDPDSPFVQLQNQAKKLKFPGSGNAPA